MEDAEIQGVRKYIFTYSSVQIWKFVCRYLRKYKSILTKNYARIKTEYIGILGYAVNLGRMKKQQLPYIRPK